MNGDKMPAGAPKKFVLDSSTIITISDNCLIRVMKNLAQKENISFIIPQSVYTESVETPIRIRKYELNAIRIRDAVDEGYIRVQKSTPQLRARLERLQSLADNLCTFNGERMRLLQLGEMETLALMREINADALGIDERTTRMLIEEPRNLLGFLRKRHEGKILLNDSALSEFAREYGNIKIVRSAELIALAYEDGSFGQELHTSKQALEAALFAAKYGGGAGSADGIKKNMGQS